jgi:hypothetical protein
MTVDARPDCSYFHFIHANMTIHDRQKEGHAYVRW